MIHVCNSKNDNQLSVTSERKTKHKWLIFLNKHIFRRKIFLKKIHEKCIDVKEDQKRHLTTYINIWIENHLWKMEHLLTCTRIHFFWILILLVRQKILGPILLFDFIRINIFFWGVGREVLKRLILHSVFIKKKWSDKTT